MIAVAAAAASATPAGCSVHVAVPLQREPVAEAHVADVATKRPLARVHLPMVFQVCPLKYFVYISGKIIIDNMKAIFTTIIGKFSFR